MPDLPSLLSYLPTIWTAVTGLLGGGAAMGLVKAYRTYHTQSRQDDAQEHRQNLEMSERLETRLTAVEGRLDSAESELRKTREQLSRSQIREQELKASLEALVQRVDRLLDRLAKHEDVSERERKELTSPPYIDLKSNSNSSE
jgi:septal ring factor EnvC (AmiA/AmiB activator)